MFVDSGDSMPFVVGIVCALGRRSSVGFAGLLAGASTGCCGEGIGMVLPFAASA